MLHNKYRYKRLRNTIGQCSADYSRWLLHILTGTFNVGRAASDLGPKIKIQKSILSPVSHVWNLCVLYYLLKIIRDPTSILPVMNPQCYRDPNQMRHTDREAKKKLLISSWVPSTVSTVSRIYMYLPDSVEPVEVTSVVCTKVAN